MASGSLGRLPNLVPGRMAAMVVLPANDVRYNPHKRVTSLPVLLMRGGDGVICCGNEKRLIPMKPGFCIDCPIVYEVGNVDGCARLMLRSARDEGH